MNREVLFKMLHDQKRLGLASAIARIVGRYRRWRIKARQGFEHHPITPQALMSIA